MRVFNLIKLGLWTLVLTFSVGSAHALVMTYDLDTEFSGASDPAGPAPWVTATFDDGGTAGSVTLTLDTMGLMGTEFLSSFYFNIDDTAFNPALVSVSNQDNTDTSFIFAVFGADCCKPNGDGFMDFQFQFDNNDFTANETWSIDLTLAGITAASFDFRSTGAGNSPTGLFNAAHIQSIRDPQCPADDPTCGSGWITGEGDRPPRQIPEPGMLALLASGLLSLVVAGRRRRQYGRAA